MNPEKCAAQSFMLLNCKKDDSLLEKQRMQMIFIKTYRLYLNTK
ncbi:hypothetical protein [Vibrio cyclitrophicus]